MASTKRLNFYYGRVIDVPEGLKIWEGVENFDERMARGTFNLFNTPSVLLEPPVLDNLSGDTLDIGPWEGWSNSQPAFQEGSTNVDFSEATHGSLVGPVDVVTPGKLRSIVIMARYTTVEVGDAIDDNGVPVKKETHHAIEYRVIMGPEYDPGTTAGQPADYDSEITAGSIPLVTIVRDDVQANTVYPNYDSVSCIFGSMASHKVVEGMFRKPGVLGTFDPDNLSNPNYTLDSLTSFNTSGTAYVIRASNVERWAARIDGGRFITSQMVDFDASYIESNVLPGEGAGGGTFLLRLKIDDDNGKYRPLLYTVTYAPPTTEDARYDAIPASREGDETGGTPSTFPTTAVDIAVAIITYDGLAAPTVTELHNPNTYDEEFITAISYSASDWDFTLTPAVPLARLLRVTTQTTHVDYGDGGLPANRDGAHNINAKWRYQDFQNVYMTVKGSLWDTSGASPVIPGSNEYFRPANQVTVEAIDPS